MKRMTITVLLLLLIAAIGCGKNSEQANIGAGAAEATGELNISEKVANVEIFSLEPTQFDEYLTLPVVVSPYREVSLGLTSGGKVTKLNADKGDTVTKGAVLLETDDVLLEANMNMTKATLDYQEKEYARNEQLFGDGSISEAVYDGAKLQLSQAKSAYDIAKKQFEDATLTAPFSGIVTMRNVEVGDILSPGAPAFRLIDVARVKVQAGIPEKYIADFKKGNIVSIGFDALPGQTFKGEINYISPEANPGVRTFLAEIVIDNKNGELKAGIMGNAKILRRVYNDAIMIPINAVIDTQKGRIVFVAKDDDTAEQRSVTLGSSSDLMVHVVSGVDTGDKIITRGQYDLLDGEAVNITGEYSVGKGEVN